MIRAGVRESGITPNVRALGRLGYDVKQTAAVFASIAQMGVELVRGRTPVRSGRLAGTTRGASKTNRATVFSGRDPGVPYAGVVNYGPKGYGGVGYMQAADPAWEAYATDRLTKYIDSKVADNDLG